MKKIFIQTMVWFLVFSIAVPAGVFAQSSSAPPVFRQEELQQMLAPIALYPDPLLVQMLMAATYPLEVVEAARWSNLNSNLKGDQLAEALEQKDWDPSVKSLVNFPNALDMMDGNIEWTQRLGDAFLAQKDQVMDTIQSLRGRAQVQGNLRTTEQQVVTSQDNMIAIEPANPQVMYVPTYNPSVAYGSWPYPDYPPYYYYPPGYVIGDVIGGILNFGVGLVLGAAWWGYAWGGFNWYNHGVYCNPYRYPYNYYNHHHKYASGHSPGPGNNGEWRHDPSHRKNVAYRDTTTRERYGQTSRALSDVRKDFRGHSPDTRTAAARVGEQSRMEQWRNIQGRDRSATDRRMTASTNDRAVMERRVSPPASGRNAVNRGQDNPIVVERLGTQQRRDGMKSAAPPQRPTTASAFAGTMRPSYQAPGTAGPSFRGNDRTNYARRNEAMMGSSRRVETTRPTNQGVGAMNSLRRVEAANPSGQGVGGFSGVGRGGFQSVERGGFAGKTGGFGEGFSGSARGGFSGRAGGIGGGSPGRTAGGFAGKG